MTAWIFSIYKHKETYGCVAPEEKDAGVVATGWPELTADHCRRWKYGMSREEIWLNGTPPEGLDASAVKSFEHLLSRESGMKSGDLVVAVFREDRSKPYEVLGIGQFGNDLRYERKDGFAQHKGRGSEQPYTLGPVHWIDRKGRTAPEIRKAKISFMPVENEVLARQIEETWKGWGGESGAEGADNNRPTPQEDRMENEIFELLRDARQLILYGPPGTGKTRAARRVAARLLDEDEKWPVDEEATDEALAKAKKEERFDLVVFHPSYEYDQFIGGLTVAADQSQLQYENREGPMLKLCRHADAAKKPDDSHVPHADESSKDHVLLIDEINRGNLPKLLGELLHALEYRGQPVTLPFGDKPLVVPENLYIIATMNSSDRSIGHIDVATRRRFALFHVPPNSGVVSTLWKKDWHDEDTGAKLAAAMDGLNEKLKEDGQDEDLGVGQSYFLPYPSSDEDDEKAKASVLRKINHSLVPLLREYDETIGHNGKERLTPDKPFEELADAFKQWPPKSA